jgi:chloramphenicol-sensitive protein RarD
VSEPATARENVDTPADTPAGWAFGVAAYGLWGIIPLYFRLILHVPPLEVLAHRAVWSFLLLGLTIVALGIGSHVRAVFRDRRTLLTLAGSTLLIATNWYTYIYSVTTEQLMQASLGYYITPLANMLIGVVVLGERLRRLQIGAIVLAAAGVIVLTILRGGLPWIAVSLTVTFSLYGLLRKIARAEAMVGLFVETTLLAPIAVGYLSYLTYYGRNSFTLDGPGTMSLLVLSGLVTTVPLVCFAAAARRLRMTTLGFLQFLAPTLQAIVALTTTPEKFSEQYQWSFPLIGLAVALYLADAMWMRRRARSTEAAAEIEPPE